MHINEIAKELELSPETLRKWEKDFNLVIQRDKLGQRIYDEGHLELFAKIKSMRKKYGISTINHKIGLNISNEPSKNPENIDNTSIQEMINADVQKAINDALSNGLSEITENLSTAIHTELVEVNNKINGLVELAKEYSKSTYRIGQLEAQLEAEKNRSKLLNNSMDKDLENLKKELDKKSQEMESLQRDKETLSLALEQERKKPWYKKIF